MFVQKNCLAKRLLIKIQKMMARCFMGMTRTQLSKFIADKTEYIKNLESMLHMFSSQKAADHGDLNKTMFGDDVVMANVNNDWRTFDDMHGTMKELNRQRCMLLRAELIHEKMCPHSDMPSSTNGEAQDHHNEKKD